MDKILLKIYIAEICPPAKNHGLAPMVRLPYSKLRLPACDYNGLMTLPAALRTALNTPAGCADCSGAKTMVSPSKDANARTVE